MVAEKGRTKRMQATDRMASVVSSTLPARRRPIRIVRPSERMRYSIMKLPVNFTVFETVLTLILTLGPMNARGDESKSLPVSDRVCAKLEALFKKHYPKATFENQGVNGIHFEHEVTTFEFPYNGPKVGKRVSANGGHGAEWDWRGGRVALHRRI
jgi:hypothetical protein